MADTWLGRKVSGYIIEDLIGKGGMARVYRGHDVELDRPVAIKFVSAWSEDRNEFLGRFDREARTLAQLRHPNIVGLYHKGVFEEFPYLVMEYVDGVNLQVFMQGVQQANLMLDHRSVLAICGSVVSALDYAHAKGVVHRDIKPSNILIDRFGAVYLTDFGLALQIREGTFGNAFGSPLYMSPEQIISSANASPQSDLYSLGVILYWMLTGKKLFEHSKALEIVRMHAELAPTPPSEVNPNLQEQVDRVLLRLLSKKPQERHASGEQLQLELAYALGLERMARPTYQPYTIAKSWLN